MVADAGPCVADDTLSAAAASLLLLGRTPSSEELVQAVREAGSDAVLVRALHQSSDDAVELQAWLKEVRAHADSALVCGQARGSAGVLLVTAPRGGTLAPLSEKSSVVRGSLAPGFERAELVVSDATGHLLRLGIETSMLSDGVPLSEDLPRPATIQLVAHGPLGPRPVAERVLPAAAASVAAKVDAAPKPSAGGSDGSLHALLAELRQARGRPSLRANRVLDQVAQAHARDVCAGGRVAHELTPGEDPQVRLQEAGITARIVGETVARASTVRTAFSQLGQSPSHLLTLLEPHFTDAGTGTAIDTEGRTCVVVLLASWPRYVGH